MSRTSTFRRLDGCPRCGGALRAVTPLSPDAEVFQCEACAHRFAEGSG